MMIQLPGLIDVYEAPRLMRLACILRTGGWALRYAWKTGSFGNIRWKTLWRDSSRHRWSNYWCCDGMAYYSLSGCGCYGITTAEYYTIDDWREVSYDELCGKGKELNDG